MDRDNFTYQDTDSLTAKHDCDYCINANTCEDLNHDNDLSYKPCGVVDAKTRMYFKTGDRKITQILVEIDTPFGVDIVAHLIPNYCPFCGRELIENTKKYNIRRMNKGD